MRFLHIADAHLGYQQYNSEERLMDFRRAFRAAVNLALEHQVDACLIAGDFFHKPVIDPLTLHHAEVELMKLAEAGVLVVAVHGNHDRVRYRDRVSWMDYLNRRELIILLEPKFDGDALDLEPERSYVDIGEVRFIGVPWYGASAPRVLEKVGGACATLPQDDIRFTVLITHAGMEGQMPDMHDCLRISDLDPLRDHVQYVALGHIHKPYVIEDWIYNPGSLEACSFNEADYERGVYLVDVDLDGGHTAEHIPVKGRPFHTLPFQTDVYPDPDALLNALRQTVRGSNVFAAGDDAVVRLVLRGNLTFDRAQLNMEAIRRMLDEEIDALIIRVDNQTTPLGFDFLPDENMSRHDLERTVFEDLARGNSQYSAHAVQWGQLMGRMKHLALDSGVMPEEIFAVLDRYMDELNVLEEEGSIH